jgi:hypothetical protein
MKRYPKIVPIDQIQTKELLLYITRERDNDVLEFNNLPEVFMRGRKVGKVPVSSTDVDSDDRVGDFNYTGHYMYLCVDDGGVGWRGITLHTFP